jgi:peptide/nickel transport system permease protein
MARRIPPIWNAWFWGDATATWNHPLGTDRLGRDYWSRIVYGARISLIIGLTATLISGCIGTFLGVMAGYFGGKVDAVISFLITTRLAMPFILVALAVVGLIGPSLKVIMITLGLLLWDRFAVVMRTATMQIRSQEYIVAARAVGCSVPRIIFTEILPNLVPTLIVVGTVEMAVAILSEAALSFVGMGVQPPLPSWGLMLAEAKEEIFFTPWMITIPGVAIFLLVLAINLLGDGIRDATAGGRRT